MKENESKRDLLTNRDFTWEGAHTIKVYKISTSPMNDYDRGWEKLGIERADLQQGGDGFPELLLVRGVQHVYQTCNACSNLPALCQSFQVFPAVQAAFPSPSPAPWGTYSAELYGVKRRYFMEPINTTQDIQQRPTTPTPEASLELRGFPGFLVAK